MFLRSLLLMFLTYRLLCFSIYLVTWNVGTKFPESVNLHSLLGVERNPENDQHLPDIFVVGLQEVNSQPQNVVIGLFKEDPWTQKLKEVLKERDYVAVKTEQMQGLLIIMFAQRRHLTHLRNIETEFTRTGLGGIWGNKGAVSIRLNLYGSGIACLNSHLAAHDHNLDERINDFEQIMEHHHYHVKKFREIFDHDYVFWMGDLNFRLELDSSVTPQNVRQVVREERLDDLLKNDQLTAVRSQKKAFHQLNERLPAFPPTFKFEPGTVEYDMKRRPAWTDRILYKAQETSRLGFPLKIEQISYKSHPAYNISDHKPVTSEFVIQIFPDPDEKSIEFNNIPIWYIGEENKIEYKIPHGFNEKGNDWIGVYRSNFHGLDEYIAYEYTSSCKSPKPERHSSVTKCTISLEFSESIDLDDNRTYVLLYFQSSGLKGVTGLAGISNVFTAEKRPPSPRFEAVD